MTEILLNGTAWWYDESQPLGESGGFGQVFAGGMSEGQTDLAVKRLHLDREEAGGRELQIAEDLSGRDLEFVVPIRASGEDDHSGRYFVVMERAHESLRQRIQRGTVALPEMLDALYSIAQGLLEVQDIVHRDLKPENVLLHDGVWKVADFGIARFAEAATSSNTLRGFLSSPYAAPEQWRDERATGSTDVYALGCIAYELCTGAPPFRGPNRSDYRDQHLGDPPAQPEDSGLPAGLVALVLGMLRKESAARVSIARVAARLRALSETTPTDAQSPLSEAAVVVAVTEAAEEAAHARAEEVLRSRAAISNESLTILQDTMDRLFARVLDEAPPAQRFRDGPRVGVHLGSGRLWYEIRFAELPQGAFEHSQWDVLAGASIHVRQASERYPGRGASLWYGRTSTGPDARWTEVPYMFLGRGQSSFDEYPFALSDVEDADIAASNITHVFQHAAVPTPIDDEHFEAFLARWIARLAAAAQVQLQYPSHLPE